MYTAHSYVANIQSAWAVLSLYIIANFGPHGHSSAIILILDFVNWSMFLAVWIALAANISSDTSYCGAGSGDGQNTSTPCQTIYAAFAFAIAGWIFFTHTLTRTTQEILDRKEEITRQKQVSHGDQNA
jgi:hypothetical protein